MTSCGISRYITNLRVTVFIERKFYFHRHVKKIDASMICMSAHNIEIAFNRNAEFVRRTLYKHRSSKELLKDFYADAQSMLFPEIGFHLGLLKFC